MSLDGDTALLNGKSKWITSEAARQDGHYWRARSGAILTGRGTVEADNPLLNVRGIEGVNRQPLKVIVDSHLRLNPECKIFEGGNTLIVCADYDFVRAQVFEDMGVEVLELKAPDGQVDLKALMKELAKREINEVHVEAGAKLNGALYSQGLIDEFVVYAAPLFLGMGRKALELPELTSLDQAKRLKFHSLEKIGEDIRMILRQQADK